MKRRLLVIGSHGFIGRVLLPLAEGRFETSAGEGIDIACEASVEKAFEQIRPDVVILLAAISDIDRCERAPDLAARVNTGGAVNVAKASAARGARLIFTSTGAVFDGTRCGYVESDALSPLSVYGRTKAEAEGRITESIPEAVIVRLSLVIGADGHPYRNSLLAGRVAYAPMDEFRNPIDAATLCGFLLGFAAEPGLAGIFHVGASDCISRYELAERIAARVGVSKDLAVAGDGAAPGRAPRGKHQFLISRKASAALGIPLPAVEDVLAHVAA